MLLAECTRAIDAYVTLARPKASHSLTSSAFVPIRSIYPPSSSLCPWGPSAMTAGSSGCCFVISAANGSTTSGGERHTTVDRMGPSLGSRNILVIGLKGHATC